MFEKFTSSFDSMHEAVKKRSVFLSRFGPLARFTRQCFALRIVSPGADGPQHDASRLKMVTLAPRKPKTTDFLFFDFVATSMDRCDMMHVGVTKKIRFPIPFWSFC